MAAPAAAERLPFRLFAATEDRPVLDRDLPAASGRHFSQHPFLKGLPANEDHLPAAGVEAQGVQDAPQAWTVPADRAAAKLLDENAVGLRIDAIAHADQSPASSS